MREVCIKLNEKDYLHFLSEANEHGENVKELLYEIVNYYILVNKKRLKVRFRPSQLKKVKS
ncbi:MAG: hypothetical protein NPMRTHETA2_900004 [Nitrosopumilales archaeon]|nr:MAG: hypothetical protein NPMRTHETA2_900004 [Nitrosopumilales archaeon]